MHIPTGRFDEEQRQRIERDQAQRQAFDRTRLDRINDQAMARHGISADSGAQMRNRDRSHALDQAEHIESAKISREKAAAATSSGSRLFHETKAQHTEAHAERDQHRYEAARWNTIAAREHATSGVNADSFQELRQNRDDALQEARGAEVEMKVRAQQIDDMKAVRDGREARDGMPPIEKAKTREEFDARIEKIASPEYAADLREQFEQDTDADQLEISDREEDVAKVTDRSPAELDAAEAKREPEAEKARRQRPAGETDEQQRERVTKEMTEAYDREHPGKRCQVAETRAYRIEDRVSKAIVEENGEKPESRMAKAQQAAEKAKDQDAQRQGMRQ